MSANPSGPHAAAPRASAPQMSGAVTSIPHSKFRLYTVVDRDLDSAPTYPFPFIADSKFKAVNCGIDEPAGRVSSGEYSATSRFAISASALRIRDVPYLSRTTCNPLSR
jgi:hypothetical protein